MSGTEIESAPDYAGHSAAHTPGPWVINGTAICGQEPQLPGRDGDEYADGTFMVAESVFNERNARLIAAAPDMLAALKNIADTLEVWDGQTVVPLTFKHMDDAKAAIAKAEGRT